MRVLDCGCAIDVGPGSIQVAPCPKHFDEAARHLSPAERAAFRPKDYDQRSQSQQWEIDRRLGILDWDGETEN